MGLALQGFAKTALTTVETIAQTAEHVGVMTAADMEALPFPESLTEPIAASPKVTLL